MKVTKSYIKQIIKEEIQLMLEAEEKPKYEEDPKAKSVSC